jgi:hypothetical protein
MNDGLAGMRVVQMLEAIDESIANKGKMVQCNTAKPQPAPEMIVELP